MKYWLIILLQFILGNIFAQNILVIGDKEEYKYIDFIKLENDSLIPKSIKQMDKIKSNNWYKLDIKNTKEGSNYVLEILDFKIDSVQIFIPKTNSNTYTEFFTGDRFNFQTRPIMHKNLSFPFPKIYNSNYTIYIHSPEKDNYLAKRKNIRSFQNLIAYSLKENGFLMFYYGLLFGMALYNFVRYIFTRDFIHITYVMYVVSLSLYSLTRIDGLGFQFIWPDYPIINKYSLQISMTLFSIMSIVFATTFLNIKNLKPILWKGIMVWIFMRIMILIYLVNYKPNYDLKIIDLIVMILIIMQSISLNLNRLTKIFTIAYIFMITGFLIFILRDLKLISTTFNNYYSLYMGVFIETILLSIAIGEKTKMILLEKQLAKDELIQQLQNNESLQAQLVSELKEKEQIREKVNRELEQKVHERTLEIQEKNNLLSEQKNKIELLASQIDKQFYYLQKETTQQTKDFLWTKHLSFEKFKEIFPTDYSCIQYLEKVKWEETGFNCVKCGYSKFVKNPNNLSRKCTKCTHIESVTANTIFHGVRFPIQKAFYLAYCCVHGLDGIVISDLATLIDLRLNTCSQFLQKVKDRMTTLKLSKETTQNTDILLRKVLVNIS